jgi:hypothetical protein
MTVQARNAELVQLLSSDFQLRYDPGFSMGISISTYLSLFVLRGFWPLSSLNESNNPFDLSGQGRTLTSNSVVYGLNGLAPVAVLNGSTRYLSRASEAGLNITGNLTMGLWFNPSALGTAALEGLMGKHNSTGNQRSYIIYLNASSGLTFQVSSDGTAGGAVGVNTAGAMTPGSWYFIAARFTASTEVALWLNTEKNVNTTAIIASIFSSTAQFEIGRRNVAATFSAGSVAFPFLCASALPDAVIENLYEQTRPIFGG